MIIAGSTNLTYGFLQVRGDFFRARRMFYLRNNEIVSSTTSSQAEAGGGDQAEAGVHVLCRWAERRSSAPMCSALGRHAPDVPR
jgi:hypothetical protein